MAPFECEVSKILVPVQWYKNDEPLRKSEKYDMEVEGRVHRLIIRDVDGQDEARYAVFAKNNRSAATLTIHGKNATNFEHFNSYSAEFLKKKNLEVEWVDLWLLLYLKPLTVGHGGSTSSSYLANPTSPIPSHRAVIILFKNGPVHQLSWLALKELTH